MTRFLALVTLATAIASTNVEAHRRHHYYRPHRWGFGFALGYFPSLHFRYQPHHTHTRAHTDRGGKPYAAFRGAVRTRVAPIETEVYVDGVRAGEADEFDGSYQKLYLNPGKHEIELRLDGHRTFRTTVVIEPGRTENLEHTMDTLGMGSSRFGELVLRVQPEEAVVWIDGERWGSVQDFEEITIHLSEGIHRVEIRHRVGEDFLAEVEIQAGREARLNVKL